MNLILYHLKKSYTLHYQHTQKVVPDACSGLFMGMLYLDKKLGVKLETKMRSKRIQAGIPGKPDLPADHRQCIKCCLT